ncbi:MAG: hypothetical protein LBG58_13165 [Planctomycetaceae bacterium]|jgi:hypothetical protein|nr:hypothetical protein [Planctomycetaceae bacterium]
MKRWTKEEIYAGITVDYRWLTAAILTLYKNQTKEEQERKMTVESNRRGYNGCDAAFMSSLAQWLLAGRELSQKQQSAARRVLRKYSGQLAKIANSLTK